MGRCLASAWMVITLASVAGAQTPADPELFFNTGLSHLRDGRPQMALEDFKKAVRADGKNPYFYKGLGLAYAALRKYDDALAAFQKSLEINPYYVDVRNDLGSTLILAGRRDAGKREFLAAFNDATNPTPEISSRNLGNAFLEEKNYTEALNWFRTSVNRNKKYPDAYLGLADTLMALGQLDEVVAHLEAGARECPDSAAVVEALGEAYLKVGRLSDARARLEEARRKDPIGPVGRRATEMLARVGTSR